jgi:hypothetical protein
VPSPPSTAVRTAASWVAEKIKAPRCVLPWRRASCAATAWREKTPPRPDAKFRRSSPVESSTVRGGAVEKRERHGIRARKKMK